ncbi:DUF2391 family protein [Reinekea sp.]|jgi:uncharacterized membrane protein|uniref:DUF2391 family protein n=1 Tax=Reinekea sp. TaxID=1970455 RepID=UPI003988D268
MSNEITDAIDTIDSSKVEIKRLGRAGRLHTIVPIFDNAGKIIHRVVKPLKVELAFRDVIQIVVGATLLAIPMAFTEETWQLSQTLPTLNIFIISLCSLFFIAIFVYANFYHYFLKGFVSEYIKRVLATYFISLIVVGLLMTLIQQCPWGVDNLLAIKRIILVAFPASMSAAVTDAIK